MVHDSACHNTSWGGYCDCGGLIRKVVYTKLKETVKSFLIADATCTEEEARKYKTKLAKLTRMI